MDTKAVTGAPRRALEQQRRAGRHGLPRDDGRLGHRVYLLGDLCGEALRAARSQDAGAEARLNHGLGAPRSVLVGRLPLVHNPGLRVVARSQAAPGAALRKRVAVYLVHGAREAAAADEARLWSLGAERHASSLRAHLLE